MADNAIEKKSSNQSDSPQESIAPSVRTGQGSRRWWSVGGAAIGVSALAWALWQIDYARMQQIVAGADVTLMLLVPLAIAAEQLVRAWKWRQLLHDIRPIRTLRLFGAIMAGYFANLLIPLGVSPLVRSWLVARLEGLRMSAVLATVAIDRFIDGVIFVGFVVIALAYAVFPDPTGNIRLGLVVGGIGNLILFASLLTVLARYKRGIARPDNRWLRLTKRLPGRIAGRIEGIARGLAEGIVWPRARWRGVGIVLASILVKLIAITHFLWAGLAFGIVLRPADYVFLVVFLGFLIILTRLVRIPGGFFVGAIYALGLLGVDDEEALAMVVVVQFSSVLTVAVIGAFALWRNGIAIGDLRSVKGSRDGAA